MVFCPKGEFYTGMYADTYDLPRILEHVRLSGYGMSKMNEREFLGVFVAYNFDTMTSHHKGVRYHVLRSSSSFLVFRAVHKHES